MVRFKILAENSYPEIFHSELIDFLVALHERFNGERLSLLDHRKAVQKSIDQGQLPTFLSETKAIRESDWQCHPLPHDILDRRVEITGPVDRKMIINALNSGAKIFMADFEDSCSPTWENLMDGQKNLYDAVRRQIDFTNEAGKSYALKQQTAVLMVRPRGLHLPEKHIHISGEETSGSLIDFGIFFYKNAKKLIENGSGPYFYLPKLEHHLEARWWNEVFLFAQKYCDIPSGSIKATVLIETITAAFQMEEILYELKEHSAGLNCGRWDYIFSFIKKFRNLEGFVLPDRAQVTMTSPFMEAYSKKVIQTCHKRGVHAMGGMAAQIPIKNDEEKNKAAFQKVKDDKEREAKNGHDGTWVAHPDLVAVAMEIFNQHMPQPNQIATQYPQYHISEADLLQIPKGEVTEKGLRDNINVGILYIESWLSGSGAAALYHLMEDAATAEISRTQVWQWYQNDVSLNDGRSITQELITQLQQEEMEKIKSYVGEDRFRNGKFPQAQQLFNDMVFNKSFDEFLTLKAYPLLD